MMNFMHVHQMHSLPFSTTTVSFMLPAGYGTQLTYHLGRNSQIFFFFSVGYHSPQMRTLERNWQAPNCKR